MRKILVFAVLLLTACRGSKMGYKSEREVTVIKVRPGMAVNPDSLAKQTEMHELASRGAGIFDPTAVGSSAFSLAISAVKNTIDNEKEKYEADYDFTLSADEGRHLRNDSMYFYEDMSKKGPFDAEGMQFTGFSIARVYNEDDTPIVAMRAVFELDTANLYEIVYDGIFRLRLKEIMLNYAKAKVPRKRKKIDMDINVAILASYLTREGQVHSNDTIGRFETTLKGITLQNADSCKRFANKRMKGWSFIVPRSYCRDAHGSDLWNQGSYKVYVSISESAKPKKASGWILDNGDDVIDKVNDMDIKGWLNTTPN